MSVSEKTPARMKAEARVAKASAAAEEKEKKRASDIQAQQLANVSRWRELINAAGEGNDVMINPKEDPKEAADIMKLAMKGISPNMRGSVWPLLIGNAIKFSQEEFETLRQQADELRISAGLGSSFGSRVASPWMSQPGSGHQESALLSTNENETRAGGGKNTGGPSQSYSNSNSNSSTHWGVLPTGETFDSFDADPDTSGGSMTFAPTPESSSPIREQATPNRALPVEVSIIDRGAKVGANGEGEGDGKSKGLVLIIPATPATDENEEVEANNSAISDTDIGTGVGIGDIDLSKAFAFDMPTPPRKHSLVVGDRRGTGFGFESINGGDNLIATGADDADNDDNGNDNNIQESRNKNNNSDTSLDGLVEKLQILERDMGSNKEREKDREREHNENARGGHNTALLIKWDLPRTFPTLKFFHDGGSMQADLERILCAYTLYRPDVGYVQGMSFVAALLLLYLDDSGAFQCLANLLSRKGNSDFFSLQQRNILAYVHCFDHFFELSLPLLFSHMRSQGLSSEMFLMDWHLTLFAKALPLDVAARVWDCYLAGGELFFLRCALGILRLYAPHLCQINMEEQMAFLTHLPMELKAEDLLTSIEQIQISERKYKKFVDSYLHKREREEKEKEQAAALSSPKERDAAVFPPGSGTTSGSGKGKCSEDPSGKDKYDCGTGAASGNESGKRRVKDSDCSLQ